MTHGDDAKHRAQEAAGEVWEPTEALIDMFRDRPAPPPSERDAIVYYLRFVAGEANVHHAITETINVVADAIERGDHLKGDVA